MSSHKVCVKYIIPSLTRMFNSLPHQESIILSVVSNVVFIFTTLFKTNGLYANDTTPETPTGNSTSIPFLRVMNWQLNPASFNMSIEKDLFFSSPPTQTFHDR